MKTTPNINFEFYKEHDNVPIEKVAEVLGLSVKRGGMILCPCHDDHNPSCVLTTKGKFANKFKCWSCNESGGPIELVMAVKYGITPSQYRSDRSEYSKQLLDSVKYLDKYFPGGITHMTKSRNFIPIIPPPLLKQIGFPVYYFEKSLTLQKFLNTYYYTTQDPANAQEAWNKLRAGMVNTTFYNKNDLNDLLEISEKIDFLQERVDEYLAQEEQKQMDFWREYPDMPPEGRRYMVDVFSKKYEDMHKITDQLDAFRDTFIEPYMDEIHRMYLEDKEADELAKIKAEDLEEDTERE